MPRRTPPDEVPWLDEREMQVWLALVSVLLRVPAALDSQLRRDAGLSHFEYFTLAALSTRDDRTMRMSEIAAIVDGSLSRLSHACRRLEAEGWIERAPDPDDRRATLATLTDRGYRKLVASAPGHVRTVRSLVFDPLTPSQLRQLLGIAQRIGGAVDDWYG